VKAGRGPPWARTRARKVSGEAVAVNALDVPHTIYVPGGVAIGANQYSEVTISAIGSAIGSGGGGPLCRANGATGDAYIAAFDATSFEFVKLSGGGGAVLGSVVPFTPAVGHVYRLECLNTSPVQLNFYDNGSLLFSASDASAPLASGSVGFFLNGTVFKVTAWAGGDAVADTIPPTNPTNLMASATGSASVDLSWTASTDNSGIFNYRVERAPFAGSCGAFVEVAQPTTTAYTDSGLSASTTYCYRVRAFDGTNFSVTYTNTVTVTTLALRTISLAFDDNAPNAQNPTPETGFQWERCAGAACSNFTILTTVGPNVTTFVDITSPAPIAGYRVTAVPTGDGYSNIFYSTPAVPPAVLSVAPASFTFSAAVGTNPATQPMTISNGGGAGMTWTISDNASWLSVAPASGTDNAVVVVTVNVTGLASGTYNAIITVTAAGANGSPATIPVTLSLSPVTNPATGNSGRIR